MRDSIITESTIEQATLNWFNESVTPYLVEMSEIES